MDAEMDRQQEERDTQEALRMVRLQERGEQEAAKRARGSTGGRGAAGAAAASAPPGIPLSLEWFSMQKHPLYLAAKAANFKEEMEFTREIALRVQRTMFKYDNADPDTTSYGEGFLSPFAQMSLYLKIMTAAPLTMPSLTREALRRHEQLNYDMLNLSGTISYLYDGRYTGLMEEQRGMEGEEFAETYETYALNVEGFREKAVHYVVVQHLPALYTSIYPKQVITVPGWYLSSELTAPSATCLVMKRLNETHLVPYCVEATGNSFRDLENVLLAALERSSTNGGPAYATVLCVMMGEGHAVAMTYSGKAVDRKNILQERRAIVLDPMADGFRDMAAAMPSGKGGDIVQWMYDVSRPESVLKAAADKRQVARDAVITPYRELVTEAEKGSDSAAMLAARGDLRRIEKNMEDRKNREEAQAALERIPQLNVQVMHIRLGLQGQGAIATRAARGMGRETPGDMFMCGAWAQLIATALVHSAWIPAAWPLPLNAGVSGTQTVEDFTINYVLGYKTWSAHPAFGESLNLPVLYRRALTVVEYIYALGVSLSTLNMTEIMRADADKKGAGRDGGGAAGAGGGGAAGAGVGGREDWEVESGDEGGGGGGGGSGGGGGGGGGGSGRGAAANFGYEEDATTASASGLDARLASALTLHVDGTAHGGKATDYAGGSAPVDVLSLLQLRK